MEVYAPERRVVEKGARVPLPTQGHNEESRTDRLLSARPRDGKDPKVSATALLVRMLARGRAKEALETDWGRKTDFNREPARRSAPRPMPRQDRRCAAGRAAFREPRRWRAWPQSGTQRRRCPRSRRTSRSRQGSRT